MTPRPTWWMWIAWSRSTPRCWPSCRMSRTSPRCSSSYTQSASQRWPDDAVHYLKLDVAFHDLTSKSNELLSFWMSHAVFQRIKASFKNEVLYYVKSFSTKNLTSTKTIFKDWMNQNSLSSFHLFDVMMHSDYPDSSSFLTGIMFSLSLKKVQSYF